MEEKKYILIDEKKRREELQKLSIEELIKIILDAEEKAEDVRLEGMEEYD